ncbi:putative reverse transcriptase domain-containing protein [Tanacetum coccineum]
MERLGQIYIHEIVAHHGPLISIILDRYSRFTSRFWRLLQRALGTQLDMSTAYHPQTDGQSERTIQTMEDMLRVSPLCWLKAGDRQLTRLDIIHETVDRITTIKERLRTARSRQKSYADNHQNPLEFQVGDRVLLKVSPWKGMIRFGKRGNLSPRYVGPFQTLEKVGPVAYKLELPQELSGIHNVFYVSSLKKCLTDETLVVLLEEIQITDKLQFIEEPLEIMDREVK